MLSGSSGSTHDYLSLVTYIKGFSQFKASKANLLCISLNFLLSGCSVISGGLVTWERVSQWIVFVLGRRSDEHQVGKEHSCFSSTLI